MVMAWRVNQLTGKTAQPATSAPSATQGLIRTPTQSAPVSLPKPAAPQSQQQGAQQMAATTTPAAPTVSGGDPWKALGSGGIVDQTGLIRLLHFDPDSVKQKIASGEIRLTAAASKHFYDNIMANTEKQQARLNSQSPSAQRVAQQYLNDPLNQAIVNNHIAGNPGAGAAQPGGGGQQQAPAGGQGSSFWDEMNDLNPNNVYSGGGSGGAGSGQQQGSGSAGGQPGAGSGSAQQPGQQQPGSGQVGGQQQPGQQGSGYTEDQTETTGQPTVAGLIRDLSSQDSELSRLYRTQGMQAAASRGLLNTSMGAQAGLSAMLANILPIASQDSAQAHQMALQVQDILGREKLQAAQLAAEKERLGMQLTSQERLARDEINAAMERLQQELGSRERISQQDIDAAMARLQTDLSSREGMNQAQLDVQRQLEAMQRESQERIAQLNVQAGEREAASRTAAQFESTYSQMVSNIYNNPEIPATARQQYLDHAARVRDSNLRLVEQMYNIELDWQEQPQPNQNPYPWLPPGVNLPSGAPV